MCVTTADMIYQLLRPRQDKPSIRHMVGKGRQTLDRAFGRVYTICKFIPSTIPLQSIGVNKLGEYGGSGFDL